MDESDQSIGCEQRERGNHDRDRRPSDAATSQHPYILSPVLAGYFRRVAEIQGDILLGLTYLAVVGPVWLLLRTRRRRLIELDVPRWHAASRADSTADLSLPF